MERHARRAVAQKFEAEWQRGRDRLAAIIGADHAEPARICEGQAGGSIGLKDGSGKHRGLLLALGSRRIRSRCCEGKCRGPDPAAGAEILNADVRPYRNGAAAAGDDNGHGVVHGRGYKAAGLDRQEFRSSSP
jgi:hypothetical protein